MTPPAAAKVAARFDHTGMKDQVTEAVALLKSLSHVGRLQILCCLLDGARKVGDLARVLDEPQAAVSQQLMRLRAEGFVQAERQGKTMLYAIADPRVIPVIEALRQSFCPPEPDSGRPGP